MQHGRRENDDGRIEIRREAADRLQLENLAADGLDDAPAAHRRTDGHSRRRQQFHDRRHLEFTDVAAGKERQRDNAHGFLRVVRAV